MNRMNFGIMGFLIIASVLFTGCGKTASPPKISPQATQENRLDWNTKTLVTAYENFGNNDSDWDPAAKRALTEFARYRVQTTDPGEPCAEIIATNCDAAVAAGCDDPLVRYLYIKFSMSQTNTPKAFLNAMMNVQSNMQNSSYPDIRKFYASLRAAQQYNYTYRYSSNADWTVYGNLMSAAGSSLAAACDDKTMPPEEAYEAGSELISALPNDTNIFEQEYPPIEAPLLANWPNAAPVWLLKGEADTQLAWLYRGNGSGDTLAKAAVEGFEQNLDVADKALSRAWKLDPTDARIAVAMLNVELGQGQGRTRMEMWFNRAMADDPDDYDAASAKLNYIQPKWYGSTQDMLEFGRECVQSTNWGSGLSLILIDAHWDIYNQYIDAAARTNYWQQPVVWDDISSAYERYFQSYPNDTGRIAYYARYAYYARQWNKLNELIPKVSPEDYYLFGGADKFNEIAQLAKQNATPQ